MSITIIRALRLKGFRLARAEASKDKGFSDAAKYLKVRGVVPKLGKIRFRRVQTTVFMGSPPSACCANVTGTLKKPIRRPTKKELGYSWEETHTKPLKDYERSHSSSTSATRGFRPKSKNAAPPGKSGTYLLLRDARDLIPSAILMLTAFYPPLTCSRSRQPSKSHDDKPRHDERDCPKAAAVSYETCEEASVSA